MHILADTDCKINYNVQRAISNCVNNQQYLREKIIINKQ